MPSPEGVPMRPGPFLGALVVGVAAALAAEDAGADTTPLRPEAFSFRAGKVWFRRNRAGTQGAPRADWVQVPQETMFGLTSEYVARNQKGVITTRKLFLHASPVADLRQPGTVPAVFRAGFGLSGTYTVQKTTDADPVGTTSTWRVDERGAPGFTLKWKKFDPVTSRITGSFSGEMRSDVIGVRNVRITRGTFFADVNFVDLPPPPPTKQ
jgi:hypothetical protein